VLFADLKGSMELLADRDPEDARKLLDPVLERMMEAVHRYEGTVNQVMGDGIMALFGAPLAHEDHAVRACYAALRMQESVKRYAEEVFRSDGVPVQIRVGLNSGEVVVRAIGSDLHMDYSALGQTTHLAARMEQMAQPGTILLTPETLALAEGFVLVTSRGLVSVKGLARPIDVFELAGPAAVRNRLHAAASRGLTRFVGRDAEMDLLRRALERAGEGRGQVVALLGEPGVGKSRLAWEFTHSHRSQGWLVLETASVSYGKATTFFPVIELLRSYFGIEPRDDARRMREKVTGKLLSLDRALEPVLAVFLSLLDVPVEDSAWTQLDPPQRRRQTLEALKRLVLRESHVQPVLLVIEDLHWIDAETQAWLDLLVEGLPAARLLLLVNYRPEYGHGWGSKTYYQQIRLDTLPAGTAGELLEGLLGGGAGMPEVGRLLVGRTQGNPFFLEESVRALVETGALAGDRGAYRLERPVDAVQVPATVQAVLAARIDRLPPNDKALLQTAAVIGKDVPLPLLEAIQALPGEELERGLERLQAAEFLYQAALFPEREYTFKHALTHDVAYQSLLRSTREQSHRRIARTLAERFPDIADTRPELVAHHYSEGGLVGEAVTYWHLAGMRALERFANEDAIRYLTQALRGLGDIDAGARRRRELDLQIALAGAFHSAKGQAAPEVASAYERARELCAGPEDARQHFRVLLGLYRCYGGRGQAVAAELVEELYALAERSRDPDLLVEAHMARGTMLLGGGALVEALTHLDRASAIYDRERHRSHAVMYNVDPGVVSHSRASWALWALGYPDQALARSGEGLALGRAQGHPNSLGMALSWAAMLHQFRREPRAVEEIAEATVALATEHGLQQWIVTGTFLRGWAMMALGRRDGGLAQMTEAYAAYRALGLALNQSWWIDMLRRRGLLVLGQARNQERVAEAEGCFRSALDIARRQKARAFELRTATSLGHWLVDQGRRDEARDVLADIYGWFTEGFETEDLRDAKALLESVG
jgi:class 3 adenylate cyclase/predicted ATPase